MNRFHVMPCVDRSQVNENASEGTVLPLASEIHSNCILFFPVSKEVAKIANYIMEVDEESDDSLVHMVEVFKTMINTWKSGERFLSGIFIDLVYDTESEEDIINVNLMLSSSQDGFIEAVIKVSFVHAIIIAILEDSDIMVSNELLNKLLPDTIDEEEEDDFDAPLKNNSVYPVDDNILKIAKQIMNGKIK